MWQIKRGISLLLRFTGTLGIIPPHLATLERQQSLSRPLSLCRVGDGIGAFVFAATIS